MFRIYELTSKLYRSLIERLKKYKRQIKTLFLRARWALNAHRIVAQLPEFSSDDQVFAAVDFVVINLDGRPERLQSFGRQMETLGVADWRRVGATNGREHFPEKPPFFAGSLGCTLSHIDALDSIRWENYSAAVICEDDAEFLVNRRELATLVADFLSNPKLDVLALGGRVRGGAHAISPRLRIGMGIVGRDCYVVKPHMANILVKKFREGIPLLENGQRRGKGDQMWRSLQSHGYFFANPRATAVRQSAGFSDIEAKELGPR